MPSKAAVQQFDEERADAYDDRIRRIAPGYDVLQDTVASVLTTRLPEEGHLLVVGAGTGTEIVQMGQSHPQWQFTAVDPSSAMLDRCRTAVTNAGLDDRVEYVCERVEDMSGSQTFDAATSLLVAHFIEDESVKRRYFRSIAERLVPGAPLVWADLYRPPSDDAFRQLWAAWREQMLHQMPADNVERAFERIAEGVSFVRPSTLERIVTDAGVTSPTQIYQHLLWGAWASEVA